MNFENEIGYAKYLENIDLVFDKNYYSKCITIIRYWFTIGLKEDEIRIKINDKLKKIYNDYGENIVEEQINNMIKISKIKGKLEFKKVYYSKEEIDFIHSLNDNKLEEIMFVLFGAYKIGNNKPFKIEQKKLLNMVGVSYSQKNYNKYMGMITKPKYFIGDVYGSLKYNISLKYKMGEYCESLYNPNNIVLEISDFKNFVYYYREYFNKEKYFRCEECGCIEYKYSNRKKYCSDCARLKSNAVKRKYDAKIKSRNNKKLN